MDISNPVNLFPLTVVMAVASIIIVLAFGMKNLSRSNRRQILEASP
jgi:Tfp pilus assembly protein FimT